MWSISKIFETDIHLPDISSSFFHCQAKTSSLSLPPDKLVHVGPMHPTVQFTNPNMAFFKYPTLHVKAQWINLEKGLNNVAKPAIENGKVLWDAFYEMPKMASITSIKMNGGNLVWGSLDWRSKMLENLLQPGGIDWIHMKKLCVPPDGINRRLMVTATAADSDRVDVLDGPSGVAVYNVKHWTWNPLLSKLNNGVSFL